MVEKKNFSRQITPSIIDTEYRECNFLQDGTPGSNFDWLPTRIFPGDDTPRTFINCNLTNCLPPPGSILINCNTALVEYVSDGSIYAHGKVDPDTLALLPKQRELTPAEIEKEFITVEVLKGTKQAIITTIQNIPSVIGVLD